MKRFTREYDGITWEYSECNCCWDYAWIPEERKKCGWCNANDMPFTDESTRKVESKAHNFYVGEDYTLDDLTS
jgi:hypothetical protein